MGRRTQTVWTTFLASRVPFNGTYVVNIRAVLYLKLASQSTASSTVEGEFVDYQKNEVPK